MVVRGYSFNDHSIPGIIVSRDDGNSLGDTTFLVAWSNGIISIHSIIELDYFEDVYDAWMECEREVAYEDSVRSSAKIQD